MANTFRDDKPTFPANLRCSTKGGILFRGISPRAFYRVAFYRSSALTFYSSNFFFLFEERNKRNNDTRKNLFEDFALLETIITSLEDYVSLNAPIFKEVLKDVFQKNFFIVIWSDSFYISFVNKLIAGRSLLYFFFFILASSRQIWRNCFHHQFNFS